MKILLPFLLLASLLTAQVTVLSPTSSFNQVVTSSGTPMTDFLNDQQTGQGSDDFSVNGFYMNFVNVGGVQTQVLRFQMNTFDPKGFRGNLRIGIDATGDGAIDLFYGVSTSGSSAGIYFQNPGTGLNVSPSTTTLGTNYGMIALTSTNYSYVQSDVVADDAMISFSVPFASINSALQGVGIQADSSTFMRFIAFTATQSNSINQDMYGTSGINSAVRFDAEGGGFTEFQNFNGARPVVPEPSTYGAILMGILLSLFGFRSVMKHRPIYNRNSAR